MQTWVFLLRRLVVEPSHISSHFWFRTNCDVAFIRRAVFDRKTTALRCASSREIFWLTWQSYLLVDLAKLGREGFELLGDKEIRNQERETFHTHIQSGLDIRLLGQVMTYHGDSV